jgi:putative SbcD/Mre11-related phosphoesterase
LLRKIKITALPIIGDIMFLRKDVELLEGLPIAYIKSIDSIVLSDLHLGYESHMARKGVFIPKVNLKKILKEIGMAISLSGAKSIIVVGDIKNEFSTVGDDEFNELYEIIEFCKKKKVKLVLIKGNHDNFIERYKKPFGLEVLNNEAQIGKYFFFHGDRNPKFSGKPKMLISGHEHPAIGIVKSVGRTERLRCFLLAKYKGVDLLVLPAISYFASGSEINLQSKENILSPVLRNVDLESAHAIAVGYGSTIDFGTIRNLRKLNDR